MSDEIRRPEIELYMRGNDKRLDRLEHDVDALAERHDADLRDLAKQRERDLERLAEQREADTKARDLALAKVKAERTDSQRWTWQRTLGVITAMAAILGAYYEIFSHSR